MIVFARFDVPNRMTLNKLQRKPKGKSRMDNPETLATLGTQNTGRRQTKQKTQKTKKMSNTDPTKTFLPK